MNNISYTKEQYAFLKRTCTGFYMALFLSLSILCILPIQSFCQTEKRIYIIDVSGSMSGMGHSGMPNTFKQIKQSLLESVKQDLNNGANVTVIPFTNNVKEVLTSDQDDFIKKIEHLYPQKGNTNIVPAWEKSIQELGNTKRNSIILVTDGEQNVGPSKDDLKTILSKFPKDVDNKVTHAFYIVLSPKYDNEIAEVFNETDLMSVVPSFSDAFFQMSKKEVNTQPKDTTTNTSNANVVNPTISKKHTNTNETTWIEKVMNNSTRYWWLVLVVIVIYILLYIIENTPTTGYSVPVSRKNIPIILKEAWENLKRGWVIPSGNRGLNKEKKRLSYLCRNPFPKWSWKMLKTCGQNKEAIQLLMQDMKKTGSRFVPYFSKDKMVDFSRVALHGFKVDLPTDPEEVVRIILEAYKDKGLKREDIGPEHIRNLVSYPIARAALAKKYGFAYKFVEKDLIGGVLNMVIHETKDGHAILVPGNIHNFRPQYAHNGYVSMMLKKINGKEINED